MAIIVLKGGEIDLKKIIACTIFTILILQSMSQGTVEGGSTLRRTENNENKYKVTMKQDFLCLMMAYPDYAVDVEKGDNGAFYLIMKSRKKILYDDKKAKNFAQKLSNPDLQDMLEQIYPLTPIKHVMEVDYDPGRARIYSLLKEVYGDSRSAVEGNLKRAGGNFRFNGNNLASKSMSNAIKELSDISRSNGKVSRNVFPLNGTYNYRVISGTNMLSPHAFGIAIDLVTQSSDYWKWASVKKANSRLSSYPAEIAEIFEKNNFIWGGKWSHFDIMHYEYRPEIILKAKYFGDEKSKFKNWYGEVSLDDPIIKGYIGKIDKVLE